MLWLALLVFAALGAIVGGWIALSLPGILWRDYNAGMNYGGIYILAAGLLIGGTLGFVSGLARRPAVRSGVLGVWILVILIVGALNMARQRRLNRDLFHGVESGDVDQVSHALDIGANIDATDSSGKRPIQIALSRRDCAMVEYLVGAFGDIRPIKLLPEEIDEIEKLYGDNKMIRYYLSRRTEKKPRITRVRRNP